jgi:predicted enzyme related to lactoylglutathione lyase
MKPTYFDMTVHDVDRARRFFESVFGWRFAKLPASDEYYRIEAGPADEPGINGGIGMVGQARISEGRPLTQVTIPVPDLEDFIVKIKEYGGYVLEPKMAIPGVGWYATCAEPGGLVFGLLEADPKAA